VNGSQTAVFRVDASVQIGTGHVMRCLTLADTLRSRGVRGRFACRAHTGHLFETIRGRGHEVLPLDSDSNWPHIAPSSSEPSYASWLGVPWQMDARETMAALQGAVAEWLVVDHYALDARWEGAMRPAYRRLLAIDDLADRPHACDMLLDQNLGREAADYDRLVPETCRVLTGAQYALLRPRFAELRNAGLPHSTGLHRLLVSMGGVDKANVTGQVLNALRRFPLPAGVEVTAVLGGQAPCVEEVRATAAMMPWPTRVLVDVADMPGLLAHMDLAIGAAGSSAWERCCMGVPSLTLVLADNQRPVARALADAGAALLVDSPEDLIEALGTALAPGKLAAMRQAGRGITDGRGVERVAQGMERVGN
jgi:UDP-2,4-diacetamido-2,4,6-trideoxy-beta-L-altropyranose hydrolase